MFKISTHFPHLIYRVHLLKSNTVNAFREKLMTEGATESSTIKRLQSYRDAPGKSRDLLYVPSLHTNLRMQ